FHYFSHQSLRPDNRIPFAAAEYEFEPAFVAVFVAYVHEKPSCERCQYQCCETLDHPLDDAPFGEKPLMKVDGGPDRQLKDQDTCACERARTQALQSLLSCEHRIGYVDGVDGNQLPDVDDERDCCQTDLDGGGS